MIEEGFSKLSTLVSWIKERRLVVSQNNLNNAIGDCQNSGHRKLNWKETPRQDCVTQGVVVSITR